MRKPIGSNNEQVTRNTPRFECGASGRLIWKVNLSDFTSHEIPNARRVFSVSMLKVMLGETSDAGSALMTSLLLLTNFVRRKLPHFIISISSNANEVATSTELTDLSRSST